MTALFTILAKLAALGDDIALMATSTMDDVATAAKKTASILADDMAAGCNQSSKFTPDEELGAVNAVLQGALKNKVILLPVIFTLSYFYPVAITMLLLAGAAYLAYEGFEAVMAGLGFSHEEKEQEMTNEDKIKSAIKTDFVLSIEIIVIALSSVMDATFMTKVVTTTVVAIGATIAIYGVVAMIVRIDDLGLVLIKKGWKKTGLFLVKSLSYIIKILAVVGTIAMFLVAGGILVHHSEQLHHLMEHAGHLGLVLEMAVGFILGLLVVAVVTAIKKGKELLV